MIYIKKLTLLSDYIIECGSKCIRPYVFQTWNSLSKNIRGKYNQIEMQSNCLWEQYLIEAGAGGQGLG